MPLVTTRARRSFAAATLLGMIGLTACGTTQSPEGGGGMGPPVQCDYQGPSGICVGFDPDVERTDPAEYEQIFLATKQEFELTYDVNLSALPGPVVRVVSFYPNGHRGWTEWRTGQITLQGTWLMRHETFHYILLRTGYPNDLNAAHDHPVFDDYRESVLAARAGTSVTPH